VIEMTETLLTLKGDTIHHAINHCRRLGRWENLHQFVDCNSMLLICDSFILLSWIWQFWNEDDSTCTTRMQL
jgi:hypothetical protein